MGGGLKRPERVHVSIYNGRHPDGRLRTTGEVTTTWLQYTADDGTPFDITAEEILDMPTHIVVGCPGQQISGDQLAFKVAHMGGKQSARDYALRHTENVTSGGRYDHDETQRRRMRIMGRIQRMVDQEQRALAA